MATDNPGTGIANRMSARRHFAGERRRLAAMAAGTVLCLAAGMSAGAAQSALPLRYLHRTGDSESLLNHVEGLMQIEGEAKSAWKMTFDRTLRIAVNNAAAGGAELLVEAQAASGDVEIDQPSLSDKPIRFRFKIAPYQMSGTLDLGERKVDLDRQALQSLKHMLGIAVPLRVTLGSSGAVEKFEAVSETAGAFGREEQADMVRWVCGLVYPPLPSREVRPGDKWSVTPGTGQSPRLQTREQAPDEVKQFTGELANLERFIKAQIQDQRSASVNFGRTNGIISAFFWPFEITYTLSDAPEREGAASRIVFTAQLKDQKLDLKNDGGVLFVNLDLSGSLVRDFQKTKAGVATVNSSSSFRRSEQAAPFLKFQVKAECRNADTR